MAGGGGDTVFDGDSQCVPTPAVLGDLGGLSPCSPDHLF